MSGNLGIGLGLIIAGFVSILLILIFLRLLPRNQAEASIPLSSLVTAETLDTKDGMLIIQSGGRVEFVNASARRMFGLRKEEFADLERLATRARPSDEFLALCSEEGQKRITVGSQLAEATSYLIPGVNPLMLVTLRSINFTSGLLPGEEPASISILRVITDFGQAVAANLRLNDTLSAVLDNIGRLLIADILEVQIWDASKQVLIPFRYEQYPDGLHKVTRASNSAFGNLSNALIEERKTIFLPNLDPESRELSNGFIERGSVYSYIGVPLLVGDDLVGTLEAGQLSPDGFSQQEVELLQLLAGQAANAIHNAMLFETEQRRAAELAGLADLGQAISGSQDLRSLFEKLVKSIAPLFNLDIIGFLLLDEDKLALEGQIPFHGLPPHIVEMYRANISDHEVIERIIENAQPILTLNASQDAQWNALGIQNFAQAASLRDSGLMPLVAGRRLIGFLQLSNHKQGVLEFSDEELRLMNLIANQATAIIENAVLVLQSQQRAYRSDSLRRIASLSASSASLDEVLEHSVRELAQLYQAEMAAIFLLDEKNGELVLHTNSLYGVQINKVNEFARLFVSDAQFRFTVTGSQKAFISGRLSSDPQISSIYRPMIAALDIESAIVVPLLVHEQSLGELMMGSRKVELFNSHDLQVLTTAAGQLASVLENAHLAKQTDEDLRVRVDQLTALMRISRELTSSLDLHQVLEVVQYESLRTTNAECGSILLFDAPISGVEPAIRLSLGCPIEKTLPVLVDWALKGGETLVIRDFLEDKFDLPHDGVRSALLVPILQQGKVAGAIYLHAMQPNFFGKEIIDLIQTMAVQASIALNTASQYQSERQRAQLLHQRANAISRLTEINYIISSEKSLEQQLIAVGNGIRETTPFKTVLFSVYEPETGLLRRILGLGFPQDVLSEILSRKQPLTSVQQLFKPEFQISRSYLIPVERTPVVPAEVNIVVLDIPHKNLTENAWKAEDLLITPLTDAQGNPLGLISLDAPLDGLRPDKATVEIIEIFAAQAALTINNSNLFTEMRNRLETLSAGLQRQQRLLSVSQNDLPLLLRKDLEQTVSIYSLDRRAQRMRAGLAITESVSRQLDAASALQALGREILTQLGMSVALVAEDSPEGPRLLNTLGSVPRATNPETLFGQRNPLRSCLQTGETILFENIDDTEEWRDTPLLSGLRAKSFICLPIKVEERVVAAILAVSPEPLPAFTDEDRHIYHQISRQASVVLQNIHLLNETRRRLQEVDLLLDFSRHISGLDPIQIVKSLLESARRVIQAAHAGMVLLWDEVSTLLVPVIASGYADNESLMMISYHSGEALLGKVFESGVARRLDELDFAREYALSAENLLLFRKATGGRLPVSCLVIPIVASGQSLGVLTLDNFNTQAAFKPADETLLLSLSQQVALSLENVRLVQSSQERAGQLQALNDVAASMTASLRSDELIATLLDKLKPVLSYDTAMLLLRSEDQLTIAAVRGFTDTDQRLGVTMLITGNTLNYEIIITAQPISVGDVRRDPRFKQIEAPHLSWLGIPLISKGEVIAIVVLEKWQANFYKKELVQIASTFAGQAAVALENARLFAETQRLAEELEQRVVERTAELEREKANTETLLRILSEVSASLDLDRALSRTLALLNEAVNAEQGTIMLLQADDDLLHYRAGYGYLTGRTPLSSNGFTLKMGEGLAGWVVEHRESVLVPDLHQDQRWVKSGSVASEHRSSIATPLLVGEDVIGVLMVFHRQANFFGRERLGMVKAIAGQVAIAINNAHLYELIRDQAERLGIMLRKEQEEASRSQAILEAVADGVVVTSPENKITFLNGSAIRILGLNAENMINQALDAFGGIFGKEAGAWMQTINDWSSNPASYQVGDSYAEQLEFEDGRIALVHLAPVILQNDFLGTVSIFRDITHEVEVDRLKSEFVATVSHELRTPMTSIRGYVDILLMGAAGALNENQTHFLQIVKNNTERLNILVNDLLDISRIESGRVTLSPQPVNLRDIAEDVVADALRRAQEENKPITFSLEAARDLPRIYGDEERVRQMISNLVDNAYRYTPQDGKVTVHVHTLNGNDVQVDVQDTGVGVPLEDQERIFDRFFRGEDPLVLAAPGTGLGLAIVKQLVEMHSGRIWLESEGTGKGSTFSFTLPIYKNNE